MFTDKEDAMEVVKWGGWWSGLLGIWSCWDGSGSVVVGLCTDMAVDASVGMLMMGCCADGSDDLVMVPVVIVDAAAVVLETDTEATLIEILGAVDVDNEFLEASFIVGNGATKSSIIISGCSMTESVVPFLKRLGVLVPSPTSSFS